MSGEHLAEYAAGFLVLAWFTGFSAGFFHRFVRRIFIKSTS